MGPCCKTVNKYLSIFISDYLEISRGICKHYMLQSCTYADTDKKMKNLCCKFIQVYGMGIQNQMSSHMQGSRIPLFYNVGRFSYGVGWWDVEVKPSYNQSQGDLLDRMANRSVKCQLIG